VVTWVGPTNHMRGTFEGGVHSPLPCNQL